MDEQLELHARMLNDHAKRLDRYSDRMHRLGGRTDWLRERITEHEVIFGMIIDLADALAIAIAEDSTDGASAREAVKRARVRLASWKPVPDEP